MSSTTPEPAPAHEGFGAHVRDWFERDIEPRLTAVEADAAKLKTLAPQLSSFASTVVALVKAVAPTAAPATAALIADAEEGAAELAKIAAELGIAAL